MSDQTSKQARDVKMRKIAGLRHRFEKVDCSKDQFRTEIEAWMARPVLGRFELLVNHHRVRVENVPASGLVRSNKDEEIERIIFVEGEPMTLDEAVEKVKTIPMVTKQDDRPKREERKPAPRKRLPKKAQDKKIPRYRG